MSISRPFIRLGGALLTGATATILVSGIALAHPETEGDDPNDCVVTVEPGTVACGDSDALTVGASVPNTALEQPSDDGVLVGVIVFLATITVAADRLSAVRR